MHVKFINSGSVRVTFSRNANYAKSSKSHGLHYDSAISSSCNNLLFLVCVYVLRNYDPFVFQIKFYLAQLSGILRALHRFCALYVPF